MKSKTLWRFFVVGAFFYSVGQMTHANQSMVFPQYPEQRYEVYDLNYIDFIYHDHEIWAVSDDGKLVIWDITRNSPGINQYELEHVTCITNTSTHHIYAGTRDGKILEFNERTHQWNVKENIYEPVYGICVMDEQRHYAITNHGVINLSSKKFYSPERPLNPQFVNTPEILRAASLSIICDSQKNIWIGYDLGHVGGELQVFSTQYEAYLPLHIDIEDIRIFQGTYRPMMTALPITSMSEGPDHVIYVTSGLDHLTEIYGAILQFQEPHSFLHRMKHTLHLSPPAYSGSPLLLFFPPREGLPFISKNDDGTYRFPGYIAQKDYISCGVVNLYNHKFYYYSHEGFSMFDVSSLHATPQREPFFRPRLSYNGYRRAIVLKMEFVNEHTMIFLTRFDGIGIFDGQRVRFYK